MKRRNKRRKEKMDESLRYKLLDDSSEKERNIKLPRIVNQAVVKLSSLFDIIYSGIEGLSESEYVEVNPERLEEFVELI